MPQQVRVRLSRLPNKPRRSCRLRVQRPYPHAARHHLQVRVHVIYRGGILVRAQVVQVVWRAVGVEAAVAVQAVEGVLMVVLGNEAGAQLGCGNVEVLDGRGWRSEAGRQSVR